MVKAEIENFSVEKIDNGYVVSFQTRNDYTNRQKHAFGDLKSTFAFIEGEWK